jgi:DNA-binding protein YbaB
MNINEAFRLRNRLKDKIKDLKERVAAAEYEKTKDTEENSWRLDGKTLKETIEITDSLMDLLCAFNEAIEKANAENRLDLVRMEAFKQKLAFYSGIVLKCREAKRFDYEYPEMFSTDKMTRVTKVLVLDQPDMAGKYNALKKENAKLEAKLAKQNANINVDFDASKIEEALEKGF